MNEIKKMYNRVGLLGIAVQALSTGEIIGWKPMEFTADKQLELTKWLAINKRDFGIHYRDYDEEYRWVCGCEFEVEVYRIFNEDETFEESLAGLINRLWKCLSEEEKQQIKEILK